MSIFLAYRHTSPGEGHYTDRPTSKLRLLKLDYFWITRNLSKIFVGGMKSSEDFRG